MSPRDGAESPDARVAVGVVGAGTMGAGIAQVAATAGHPVVLYDISEEVLARATASIRRFLGRAAEKGRMSAADAEAAEARIAAGSELAPMAPCALVVEAAPERLDLKRSILVELEGLVAPDAILASNTSTLSITALGASLERPERLCGMHFFNPAPLMPLVEVIQGTATREDVVERVVALARAWGKEPVRAADTPGFLVNRVARPFYGEGLRLLGERAAGVEDLDGLARDAGFPMGPFQLMDLIGIDVNFAAASSVYEGFFRDPRFRPHPIQRRMVESGRLGRKAGRGYYDYRDAGSGG